MHLVVGRVHRADDPFELADEVARHGVVIIGAIIGHANQRPAECVLVGRIEVHKIVAVGIDRALGIKARIATVPFDGRLLPSCAPPR